MEIELDETAGYADWHIFLEESTFHFASVLADSFQQRSGQRHPPKGNERGDFG